MAWGYNYGGECDVPANLRHVIAVSAGYYHSLALKRDGTIVAWGNNKWGQCDIPAHEAITKISAGLHHSLALGVDGQVIAWGGYGTGACDVPEGLTGVTDIATGGFLFWGFFSLALKADGTVVSWGDDRWGAGTLNVPDGLSDVVGIAAGHDHSLALKADGTVVAWGGNKQGQCNVPPGLRNVVAVAAGIDRSLALKEDGTVAAWGRNDRGQCDFAAAQTGVLAIAKGGFERDTFLLSVPTPSIENTEPLPFVRGEVPPRVLHRLREVCAHVLSQFELDLNDSLNQLEGAKVLLESVLALGLPHSLEQDDVLRGLLFGSESLIDREGARALYEAELERLDETKKEWRRRAPTLEETPKARLESFRRRLFEQLDALEQSGTAEIPRMIAHTLLQLRLLRAAR